MTHPFYKIATFGRPSVGDGRRVFTSLKAAIRAAQRMEGGSLQGVRVLGCESRPQAEAADVAGNRPVVWSK